MMDAINAEDIADFPDANLAESLQRLPGIALDRDNGEGRSITVRGLGSDFTRVRLNGLEALSTAAASDSGTAPNRGRGFDFNVFASDLFSSLQVRKTASANTDEGSLGATVDLDHRQAARLQGPQHRALRWKTPTTRTAARTIRASPALFADQWFDDRLGCFGLGRVQRARFRSRPLQAPGRPVRLHVSQLDAGRATKLRRAPVSRRRTGTTFGTSRSPIPIRDRARSRVPTRRPTRRCIRGAPLSTAGTFADSHGAHSVADQHRAAGSRAGTTRCHRRAAVAPDRHDQDRPRPGVFEVRPEERRQPDPVRRPQSQQHQRDLQHQPPSAAPSAASRHLPDLREPDGAAVSRCDRLRRFGGHAGRCIRRPRHHQLQHQPAQPRALRLLQQSGLGRISRRRRGDRRPRPVLPRRFHRPSWSRRARGACLRRRAMPTTSSCATSTGVRPRTPRTSPPSSSRRRSTSTRRSATS